MKPPQPSHLVVAILILTACSAESRNTVQLLTDQLQGSCIVLTRSVDVIGDTDPVSGKRVLFISTAIHDPRSVVGTLPAGTVLTLHEAVFLQTYSGGYLEISAHPQDGEPSRIVDVTDAFKIEWRMSAIRSLGYDIDTEVDDYRAALNPEVARWCPSSSWSSDEP